MKIVQIHHQAKDGSSELVRQVGIEKQSDLRTALLDCDKNNPLPKDKKYLFIEEDSPLFVVTKEE